MKNLIIVLAIIISVSSCTTETVRVNNLAEIRKSKDSIIANNFDTITFTLIFNEDANIDLIKAKAEIINGKFIDSETNELTIEPERNPDDVIIARVVVRSTTITDTLRVFFDINEFKIRESIKSIKSVPVTISVNTSAFSVQNSYESEITFSGTVLSDIGKKASDGYQVIIEDTFEDGTPVNGAFRASSLTTKDGVFSTIYSPGPIPPDQFINIKATVLDENGAITEVTNQKQIYITNNN